MAFQITIVLVGLIIGWLKRGSVWNVANLKFRLWWILPAAYMLQHLSIEYLSGEVYEVVVIISYILMLAVCMVNVRVPGIAWAIGGTVANFAALSVNGLRMPAFIPAVKAMAPQLVPVLESGSYGKSIAMSSATHLNFLGDIFAFDIHPASLISIGDILFGVGLVIIIQYAMRSRLEGNVSGNSHG